MAQFPHWLHLLSTSSLAIAVGCMVTIAVDEMFHPQKMGIMNVVWPVTALFGSVIWLAFYLAFGRNTARDDRKVPLAIAVAKGASRCGAGCTLGDLIVEFGVAAVPGIAVLFGWHSLFAERTFAVWIPDYLVAFLIGIVFQYFTIAPMRGLGLKDGILAAVKADFLSITAWQVGMYGAMAAGQFAWFKPTYGAVAEPTGAEFWFLMQLAMLAGFATAYPVNWLLISAGIKERM